MDLSEQDLLVAIRRLLSGAGPGVIVGVGDDAAVVAPGSGQLVLTTDALVEGSHFTRATATARDIGYKAIAVNVSDIAAMAASPRFALCALTLSDAVDGAWVMELFGGMRDACDEHAVSLVGGNLARGPEVTVAVTVTGEVAQGRAVTRAGAHPGDVIVVTGSLGGAAAGQRCSSRRTPPTDVERAAIIRHARPTPRVGEAAVLARFGATSMIDVSDGLALDLSRICAESGVGARVRLAEVPIGPAASLGDALGGGEDYELIATLPDPRVAGEARDELDEAFGVALTEIGAINDDPDLVAVDAAGAEAPLAAAGWDHFA
jgi:thiamine-monophosphate kinase